MSSTPAVSSISVTATPAAPTPVRTTRSSSARLPTIRSAFSSAAVTTTAVLEEHRLALHHGHRGLGADVAEPEDGAAVGDDGDGVLLDREVPDLARIVVDGAADARDARRIGHREVVASAQRRLRRHLDLTAEVEQERAVRHVLDLDAAQGVHGGDDAVDVVCARGVDGDIADFLTLLDPDEVDRAEAAARVADRPREVCERAGSVVEMDAERGAERGGRARAHAPILGNARRLPNPELRFHISVFGTRCSHSTARETTSVVNE
jgi:hypothetical protein